MKRVRICNNNKGKLVNSGILSWFSGILITYPRIGIGVRVGISGEKKKEEIKKRRREKEKSERQERKRVTKEGKKREIFGYDNSNVFELVYQTFEGWMYSTCRERVCP